VLLGREKGLLGNVLAHPKVSRTVPDSANEPGKSTTTESEKLQEYNEWSEASHKRGVKIA
jgi:hypothetical protein